MSGRVFLFDLGNTRLKVAELHADGRIGDVHARAHDGAAAFDDLPRGEEAHVASVAAPALRDALRHALETRFARVSMVQVPPAYAALRIAYADPARLGIDRFLAMLGARVRDDGAVLVVGVGTAMTLDLVDAGGTHLGGRIAPSPALMREALHARARQLPATGGGYVEFATDTDDALASGCEGAALALVERSVAQASARLGVAPRAWLHGGGAGGLHARLPGARLAPDLVLEGLAWWVHAGQTDGTTIRRC